MSENILIDCYNDLKHRYDKKNVNAFLQTIVLLLKITNKIDIGSLHIKKVSFYDVYDNLNDTDLINPETVSFIENTSKNGFLFKITLNDFILNRLKLTYLNYKNDLKVNQLKGSFKLFVYLNKQFFVPYYSLSKFIIDNSNVFLFEKLNHDNKNNYLIVNYNDLKIFLHCLFYNKSKWHKKSKQKKYTFNNKAYLIDLIENNDLIYQIFNIHDLNGFIKDIEYLIELIFIINFSDNKNDIKKAKNTIKCYGIKKINITDLNHLKDLINNQIDLISYENNDLNQKTDLNQYLEYKINLRDYFLNP